MLYDVEKSIKRVKLVNIAITILYSPTLVFAIILLIFFGYTTELLSPEIAYISKYELDIIQKLARQPITIRLKSL